jgi:hypothetical protein
MGKSLLIALLVPLACIEYPVIWLGYIAARFIIPLMMRVTFWLAGPLYVDGRSESAINRYHLAG